MKCAELSLVMLRSRITQLGIVKDLSVQASAGQRDVSGVSALDVAARIPTTAVTTAAKDGLHMVSNGARYRVRFHIRNTVITPWIDRGMLDMIPGAGELCT